SARACRAYRRPASASRCSTCALSQLWRCSAPLALPGGLGARPPPGPRPAPPPGAGGAPPAPPPARPPRGGARGGGGGGGAGAGGGLGAGGAGVSGEGGGTWLRRSQRGLWYGPRDIPPERIRGVVTFGALARSSVDDAAPAARGFGPPRSSARTSRQR